jgi:peptidoglycan hydrolase CwlO-like protein
VPRRLAMGVIALAVLLGAGGVAAAPVVEALDAQREQVRALEAELSRIDAEAGTAADAHAAAAARLRDLRAGIARNSGAARRARAEHRATRERLAERLVAIYTRRDPGPFDVLLTTGDLTDAVAVRDVQERAGRRDAALVAELVRTRSRLERTRRTLVAERGEALQAARDARERLAEVDALLERRRLVLDRARGVLDGLIARRDRAAALARARAAAERAARARAQATPPPAAPSTQAPSTPAPSTPAPSTPARPATPPAAPSSSPASRGGAGPIPGGPSYGVLNRIAQCESGGNPRAVSSSGQYRGKYQFDLPTWAGVGGSGDPAAATEAEQDLRAAMLYARRGPAPWPICGYR